MTGDGQSIHSSYLLTCTSLLQSKWEWHRECPSPNDFRQWHRYLSSLLTASNKLHQPLGAWQTQSHLLWRWFYSPSTDRIYELVDTMWRLYDRLPHITRYSAKFSYVDSTQSTPFNIIPTTVQLINENVITWHGFVPSKDYLHLPKHVHLSLIHI